MDDHHDAHLAQAQRHVTEGEQRVADQEALIERLTANGQDTTEAQKFQAVLMETLALMRRHLQIIMEERANPQ